MGLQESRIWDLSRIRFGKSGWERTCYERERIVGASRSSACSSHKWSFSAVVIRLASTHRARRGAVASEDGKRKFVALYTHTGHTRT